MSDITEFSRTISVDRIGCHETYQALDASAEECAKVAERLKLEGIASLHAELRLRCGALTGLFEVVGKANARVMQICVISGDPFPAEVEATITSLFSDGDVDMDELTGQDEWDDVELVENGVIDLGELAVQHISLALDPYPKKPGAAWTHGDETPLKPDSPFAALKVLKDES